jgi:hypothetical protein
MKSTWHAPPSNARWYCEVVFGKDLPGGGTETDYNSGYSASVEKPDLDSVWDLVPEGYTILEYDVHMTPQHKGAPV